jgi:hypothetical protein
MEDPMNLPFTTAQFLAVFERYNEAIWPLHLAAYALGLLAIALALGPRRLSDRVISAILASFWLWMGAVYHLVFFREINVAATVFGALFVIQALLWVGVGVVRPQLSFRVGRDWRSLVGGAFILYAMVAYPLLGALLGHGYPQSPSFGVAPCPTTIFTFGLLLWTRPPVPSYVLVIPLIWSLIGLMAALSLGIYEDIGLLVAGLLGVGLLIWRDRRAVTPRGLRERYA